MIRNIFPLLVFLPVVLGAQSFQWTIFDTLNSPLPTNYIASIAKNHDGTLWIGTAEGLVSKIGNSWTTYTTENSLLSVDHISALAAANDSSVWVGTLGGGMYRIKNSDWTKFDIKPGAVTDDFIHAIELRNGMQVWAATDSASYRYEDGSWNSYVGLNDIHHAIAFEKNGTVWFGEWDVFHVSGTVAWVENDTSWKHYMLNKTGIPTSFVNDIEIDHLNRKWIATGGGLVVYNDTTWEVFTQHNSHLPSTGTTQVEIQDEHNMWIGTGSGLLHIRDTAWTPYTRFNSPLPEEDGVFAMSSDNDGNIYAGTLGSGLVIISPAVTDVQERPNFPTSFEIKLRNYPNPFNPSTTIAFSIPYRSAVLVSVYDIFGREVKAFEKMNAAANALISKRLDLSGFVSGSYFVRLKTDRGVKTIKALLLK